MYGAIGSPPKAKEAYRDVLQVCEQLALEHQLVTSYQHELARTHHGLGRIYDKAVRKDEAESTFRKAIAIEKQLVQQNPSVNLYAGHLGWFYRDLADLTGKDGRTQDTLELLNQSITVPTAARKRARGGPRNFLPAAYRQRIKLLTQLGRHAEALQDWDRLIDLDEGEDEKVLWRLSRAAARTRLGEHARAVREAEEAVNRPGKRTRDGIPPLKCTPSPPQPPRRMTDCQPRIGNT